MSGGLGKSDSSQSSRGTFGQDVFPYQVSPLAGMYGMGTALAMESLGMRPAGKGGMGGKGGIGTAQPNPFGGGMFGQAFNNLQAQQGTDTGIPPTQRFTAPTTAGEQMDLGREYQAGVMGAMLSPWQQQMAGGAYGGMDLANRLTTSLEESLAAPTATQEIQSMIMGGEGNDYLDALKDSMYADAERTLGMNLGLLDQRAAAAGQSGGSRHGIATALTAEDINRALTGQSAQLGYETFDQDLNRKLQIAQQADQATLARQQMMQQMLGAQQGAMTGGLTYGQNLVGLGAQQQMFPWQQLGGLSSVLGPPVLVGQGTMTGSGGSSGKGIMGGL